MSKLDTVSASPLYQQLMEDIKLDIGNNKYVPGERIPSESELASIYNVSRITVRRAVSELCDEGYLVKQQGRGTFVTPPKITRKIMQDNNVLSFTATCAMSGFHAGAQTLDRKIVPSRMDERHFLRLPEGSNVVYLQRIRTADGKPVLLENNFFASPEFDGLLDEELDNCSLCQVLRQKYHRSPVERTTTTIEVARASQAQARLLDVTPGDSLFFVNAYFLDEKGAPIFIGRQYFVASRFIFCF